MNTSDPLSNLPPPAEIHGRIGKLLRELAMLRRLLRLAMANRDERGHQTERREVANAR